MKPIAKILVPVDFSEDASRAIETAIDLGRRYEASITLLNVLEPTAFVVFPESTGVYDGTSPSAAMTQIAEALSKAKESALAQGARAVEVQQRRGYPPQEIIDFARAGGFDLIVMGTHGRTGLAHMLIGSVAERVVRMAPCSVLTVR